MVIIPPPLHSYKKLIDSINALTLKKSQKDALLFLAKEAEKLDQKSVTSPLAGKLEKVTLKVLESTILLYQRTKLIAVVQAEELIKIIKFLSI